jgi:ABC-type multidrug transport system ATPase subunit
MELSIHNVSKTYRNGVQALKGVSLEITSGMFGLLGPNGSGKTTLMRTIATLQEPDEGDVRLGSIDVLKDKMAVRQRLGYLPQEFGVYPNVSAMTFLDHLAVLKGLTQRKERRAEVEGLLKRTNLWKVRKKKLGSFSGGMKQRFGVAQALIGSPKLIIVDEPTAGLDPEERYRFLNLLCEIAEEGIVILSTHIVEDVSETCTHMAIIREGEVLRTGMPQASVEALQGKTWKTVIEKDGLERHQEDYRVISTRMVGGKIGLHVFGEDRPDPGFDPVAPDLKDVYFATLNGYLNGR